jgi:hypothetical protein
MNNHLMLDLETLDTKPTSIVLSIGACVFNDNKLTNINELKKHSFYRILNIPEQESVNRTISLDTLHWWLTQDAQMLTSYLNQSRNSISIKNKEYLGLLNGFMHIHNIEYIWSNSPTFDMTIITSLYKDFNMEFPINFRKWLDVRTCKFMHQSDKPQFVGTKHLAIDDAINQAMIVNNILYNIKKSTQYNNDLSHNVDYNDLDLVMDINA